MEKRPSLQNFDSGYVPTQYFSYSTRIPECNSCKCSSDKPFSRRNCSPVQSQSGLVGCFVIAEKIKQIARTSGLLNTLTKKISRTVEVKMKSVQLEMKYL